jgi:uncharacterized membrane protein YebE (DUF533 family)
MTQENPFDSKQFLNDLLQTAKEVADSGKAKAKDIAEDKLNLPESGAERDAAISGMKKGAAAAGLIAVLLGTKTGRSLTGTAVKLGSVAALGTIAYKAYKNLNSAESSGDSLVDLKGDPADERSLLILKAMVSAANADGHINKAEQAELKKQVLAMGLPESLLQRVEAIIESPLDCEELAKLVSSQADAVDVYLATRVFIHKHSSQVEQDYLTQLISSLALADELVAELDKQISESA